MTGELEVRKILEKRNRLVIEFSLEGAMYAYIDNREDDMLILAKRPRLDMFYRELLRGGSCPECKLVEMEASITRIGDRLVESGISLNDARKIVEELARSTGRDLRNF